MKTFVSAFLTCALCLVPSAFPEAQSTTATIAGIVMTDSDRPTPVRRAVVTLGGSELAHSRGTITDDSGRFTFTNLPAGRFTLSVSKPSFITNAYGARRPGRPGTPLVLTAGQQLTGISVTLPRGAVVTGTIRDANGEPAMSVQVNAILADLVRTTVLSSVSASGAFLTDDRGVFRIFGLAPGDYVVSASGRTAGLAGGMGIMSPAQITAALGELQVARGRPGGAGANANPGATPPSTVALRNDPTFSFAPVFYPGTPVAVEATRITLATGEERAGVDFAMRPSRAVTVEGVITSPDGALPSVALSLDPEGSPNSSILLGLYSPQRPGPDGKFKFSNVTPGKYRISARSAPPNVSGAFRSGGPGPPLPTATGPALWASADVVINGENIEGVSLTLQPAMKFSGRIAFDATTLTPPADLTTIRLNLLAPGIASPTMVNGTPLGASVPPTPIRADGSFEAGGILPGTYRPAAILPVPSGWWLRSALVNGKDVLDTGLEFGQGGDITGAVLTFTDRHSELSGTLQTPAGSPAPDFFVIAFPADRALWRPQARRIQSTRPATDGKFTIRDLPAGDYLLAALVDVEPADLNDPKFLEQLLPGAVRVTVVDGEKKTQDLRIAR